MWKRGLKSFVYFCFLCNLVECAFNDSDFNDVRPVAIGKKEFLRQIAIPSDPVGLLTQPIPCECDNGICKCCLGNSLSIFRLKGCMEIVYTPEDFAFELRMKMNEAVLYKSKVSGKNPPPICITPPRFPFAKVCVTFYDVYFFGRNVHVCMDVGGFVEGFELFSRTFDCLRMGAQGVKIVKPEDGYPIRPNDVEIDQGDDDEIEEYDENVVRRNSEKKPTKQSEQENDDEDDDDADDDDDDDDSNERK